MRWSWKQTRCSTYPGLLRCYALEPMHRMVHRCVGKSGMLAHQIPLTLAKYTILDFDYTLFTV
jgi:hypothetical protein